jgi:DNA-binding transcriptional regulator YdaS (Cro superfamily)
MAMTLEEKQAAGVRLRRYIEIYFMSYSDFSRSLGVQRQRVHQWMEGLRPIPIHVLDRFSRLFPGKINKKDLRPDLY